MAEDDGPYRFLADESDETMDFDDREDHLGHNDRLSQGDESDNEELVSDYGCCSIFWSFPHTDFEHLFPDLLPPFLCQIPRTTDTTAAEARLGKDIQGIPWERLQFTREKYRETRLQQYKNYETLSPSHEEIEKVGRSVPVLFTSYCSYGASCVISSADFFCFFLELQDCGQGRQLLYLPIQHKGGQVYDCSLSGYLQLLPGSVLLYRKER